MCGSADADDLLQETFLLAYQKLRGFRGDSAPGTWLYRLAINRCLDHRKSRVTANAARTGSLSDERTPATVLATRTPPNGHVDRLDLERAIASLPEGAREVFLLHDVEGFQHQEIAQILGISEGTSKSQVHKARLRLRGLLRGSAE
jgi:RNA polymerase sigma-70 factor (ECF subfamily)